MSRNEVITLVDEVIQTLNERKVGYEKAAEQINNPEFAEKFKEYSAQSEKFALELLPYSDETSPSEAGTGPLSAVHRVWMDIKESVLGNKAKEVIDNCITGDEAAAKIYKGILDLTDLRSDLQIILRSQYGKISEAIGQLEAYKEQFN